jgi:hypothetical protein
MEFIKTLEIRFPSIKVAYQAVVATGMYAGWPERSLYNQCRNVFGIRFQISDHPGAHVIRLALSSFIKAHFNQS